MQRSRGEDNPSPAASAMHPEAVMSDASSERDPVERLAEEFAARLRNGEHPTLAEYAERHPGLASQILQLFPVLLAMENLKPAPAEQTGPYAPTVGGRTLERLGDYRILREVGRGGMGVVYEAEQLSLGRRVALKVLPAHALAGEQRLERFRREARAAAKLHHTNIVPVFGVGEAEGLHFYAMQFIPGQPLDQVLAELRRFGQQQPQPSTGDEVSLVARSLLSGQFAAPEPPPAERPATGSGPPLIAPSGTSSGGAYWRAVARLGVQASQALAYAHAHGILHRDVKPSNLLLDPQGTLWVTDFGLAKGSDDDNLTAAGDVVGTLRYMAPERFEGRCDSRADVYSLGLTLYELVTFRPAYGEKNREKLIAQITQEEPERPSRINPEVPRDLETIVLKAIARDPEARYPTASALAEDLQRFVEDRPILARRTTGLERLARWARRNPVVATLTGGVTVLALVLLAGAIGAAVYFSWLNHDLTDALGREKDALGKESEARQKAIEEGKKAATAADLAQQRLGRLYLENGLRSEDQATRLLWFAEALKWDHDNAERAEAHRLRLLTHLPLAPGPEHVFPVTLGVSPGDNWRMPAVQFSRNRRYLWIGGEDFFTEVWDLRTGEKVLSSPGLRSPGNYSRNPHAVGFYLDDRRFLAPDGDTVQLWDLEKRQPLTPRLNSWTRITQDGRRLVVPLSPPLTKVGGGISVMYFGVRDGETGNELFQVRLDFSPWLETSGYSLTPFLGASFSPDGKEVVFRVKEGKAAAFDLDTGKPAPAPAPSTERRGEYGSPMTTGHLLRTQQGASGVPVRSILDRFTDRQVFPPPEWGATRFLLSDDESTAFVCRPWQESPERIAMLLGSASPLGLAAGARVPGLSDAWQAWDWRAGKPLGPVLRVTSEPGRTSTSPIAPGSPVVQLMGRAEGGRLPAWTNDLLLEKAGRVLRLHELKTGKVVSQTTLPKDAGEWIDRLVLSPDGRLLLVVQMKRTERPPSLPEVASTAHVLAMPSLEHVGDPVPIRAPSSATFTRDGRYLLLNSNPGLDALHLYQVLTSPTKQLRSVLPLGGSSYDPNPYAQPSRIAFNEAHTLLANVQDDGAVQVSRLPEGKLVQSLRPRGGPRSTPAATSVEWIDADTRLLVRQKDGVEIWDMTALQVPATPAVPPVGVSPLATWVSPDGRRTRIAVLEYRQQPVVTVTESEGAGPPRVLSRAETGMSDGGYPRARYVFSRDGETLLALGTTMDGEMRSGCLRAWDAATGRRIDFPETPTGPAARWLPVSTSPYLSVAVRDGKAFVRNHGSQQVVGPFPAPDDAAEVVAGEPPGTLPSRLYLIRPNGQVTTVWAHEPGRSLDLPAEVTGLRAVGAVQVSASLAVTRPDAHTVRRWRVGIEPEPVDEVRLDGKILYADGWVAVADDGQLDLRSRRYGRLREVVPGGPFRSAHLLSDSPVALMLVGADGKCTLAEVSPPPVNGGPVQEKLTVRPLGGSVGDPVLGAALLAGKRGRLPERFLAARTAEAAYLWDRDNPGNPPTRIGPERGCRQVAFHAPPNQGALILTEDEVGITVWEVGDSKKPLLSVEGVFAQAGFFGNVLGLRRPDGRVVLRVLDHDAAGGQWRVKPEAAWDVTATKLILPVGDRLVAATADGSVRFFDPRTGEAAPEVIPHGGPVDRVETYSLPARWLTCGEDGSVRVWSRDGAGFHPVGEPHRFGKRIVRVDSRYGWSRVLVVPEGGNPRLIDLADGTAVRDFPVEEGASAWLSAGGLTVVVGNPDGSLQAWPVGGDRPTPKVSGAGTLDRVGFGESGIEDVLLAVRGGKARVYNSSGAPLGPEMDPGTAIKEAKLSTSSGVHVCLVGEDGSCSVFEPYLGRRVGEPIRPAGGVVGLCTYPTGGKPRFLIVGTKEVLDVDGEGRATQVFALDKPASAVTQLAPLNPYSSPDVPCLLLHSGKEVSPVRFERKAGARQPELALGSPWEHGEEVTRAWIDQGTDVLFNRRAVVTRAGKTLQCWSAAKGEALGPPIPCEEPVLFAATVVLPDPKAPAHLWAITPSGHRLWNTATGALATPAAAFPFGPLKEVRGNLGGGSLLLVGKDGGLWLWSVNRSQLATPRFPLVPPQRVGEEGYHSVEVVPGGNRIVTQTTLGGIRSWDLEAGTIRPGKLRIVSADQTRTLRIAGDLVVAREGALERWNIEEGRRVWQAALASGERPEVVLPGGGRLLTVQHPRSALLGSQDAAARLWDAETGKPLTPLVEGAMPRITPDGKHLLLVRHFGETKIVRAWRIDTGEEVHGLELPGDPWRGNNSPDWRYHAVAVEEPRGGSTPETVGHRIHDSRTNKVLTPILKGPDASFSADGRYVRVGGHVYELPSGNPIGPAGPELWTKPPGKGWEEIGLRGAAPGWTWAPEALRDDNDVLLATVALAVGRQIDEGGEITALTTDERAQVRRKVEAGAPMVERWRRERLVQDLKQVLAVAEKEKKWERVTALLARLEEVVPEADLKAHRIQARMGQATESGQRQEYRWAAMQFRTLFREAPERETGEDRYNAACCAARAGTGQGRGAPWRTEELPEWRKQAHDWLRGELESVRAGFEKAPSLAISRQMAYWERDDDLRAVRDPELLARLPAEEVGLWKELWSDVAALRHKGERLPVGAWKIDGKEVVQESTGPEAILLFGDPKWTDYDFEVEAMPTQGMGEVNLVVRAPGANDLTLAVVGGWGNRSHGILPMRGGQFLGAPVVAGSTKPNEWYQVKVEVRGKTCRLFVGGKAVVEHRDIPGAAGGVGLRTVATAARFRNIRVTDPAGKVLFEGLPQLPVAGRE